MNERPVPVCTDPRSQKCVMRGMSWRAAVLTAAFVTRGALAAGTPENAVGRSAELFREGRSLLAEGRVDAACKKFDESLALLRSPGTLLNIGSCRTKEGRLLAARAAFESAIELARDEPPSQKSELWIAAAEQHIAAIEPRLGRLELEQPDGGPVEVRIDGDLAAADGGPVLLDPGAHELRASARGKREFLLRFELAEGQRLSLSLPQLENEMPPPTAAAAPSPPPPLAAPLPAGVETESSSSIWKWSLFTAGAVVAAGGAVVGVIALNEADALERECPDRTCPNGLSPVESVEAKALAADLMIGAGLVTMGVAGALLWFDAGASSPVNVSRARERSKLDAGCVRETCGVTFSGHF